MPEETYIKSIRDNVRNRTELRSRIRLDDRSQRSSLRLTASRVCVCVCVCVIFSNFCDTNFTTFFFSFLFLLQFLTRAFVSRVPQQLRQRSWWTCFLGHGSHHRGSTRPSLGSLGPRLQTSVGIGGDGKGRGGYQKRRRTPPGIKLDTHVRHKIQRPGSNIYPHL